ncbi:MAG TPA: signal peptidase I [Nevskia sp.]|nr:signal peptidase I [Nevskia sp.]
MHDKLRQAWRDWRHLIVFLSLMFVFRSAVADWMVVPSGSMNPTLMEGDRIFVEKMHYGLRVPFTTVRLTEGQAPRRGDLIVFESPANGKTLVKRLIGLPGDSIALRQDRLYIDGTPASYQPYGGSFEDEMLAEFRLHPHLLQRERIAGIDHPIMVLPERLAPRDFGPVTVPADQYLMLGDNRDDSADSRVIGFVPRRLLLGRATRVVVSLNPENYLLPRMDRTLAPLE